QASVVGLGFGLGIADVLRAGAHAVAFTLVGIVLTVVAGRLLGRLYGTGETVGDLVAFGTAICGGSAVAAMAPVLGAKDEEAAVALGTVFTLNAAALVLFPPLGHLAGLDQRQFGLWAALAIHDTSSVVGAASAYGAAALAVATTVKLARAVWIVPCALGVSWWKGAGRKVSFPWFILGFLVASALRSLLPGLEGLWRALHFGARRALVVTLFLIGTGLSRRVLQAVGVRPLAQGVTLWLLVSTATLGAILLGWIS
ncbi:MAG: putative sulfate exporter family transporter, partial [Deltaproteobacteria bacterium]|nr:putative sulfate exporter family transporter [Deltaproteobacteria bacterium]